MFRITPFIFSDYSQFLILTKLHIYNKIWLWYNIYMDQILDRLSKDSTFYSGSDYYMLLLDLIPYLKYFPSVSGGEGKAYFLPNKYIVKEYIRIEDREIFDTIFDSYCKEMQGFAKSNYLVPNIYSWVKIPDVKINRGSPKIEYKYYILEERIKGRSLFSGFLEDTYHLCKDMCDKDQFIKTVENPYVNRNLFNEIVKTYVKDYIMMNQTIESLKDDEIEKFIMTVYRMFENGEYSLPDMYPSNMIYTGKDIYMIDNHLSHRQTDMAALNETAGSFTLTGLFFMFLYNETVSDLRGLPYYMCEGLHYEVDNAIQKNEAVCEAAIKRVLAVAKKCIDNPAVSDKKIMGRIYKMLKNIIGKDSASSIIEDVHTIIK